MGIAGGRKPHPVTVRVVEVLRFTDQYDATAALYGISADELRRRDGADVLRWLALRSGSVVGAVNPWLRPDRRMFLSYVGADGASYGPLAEAVAAEARQSLHTMVEAGDTEAIGSLQAAGFVPENVIERFLIRFDDALAPLARVPTPSGFSLHGADEVDEDRLFTLDNAIRNDVPGSDGWRGDRAWFREELEDAPPFDRGGYVVAVDDGNGEYIGLVRIWRNPSGPRLGLVGVLRQYRGTLVAPALLRRALTAAASWGSPTFTTETSPSNRAIYPRMRRIGAESMGRAIQLVRC